MNLDDMPHLKRKKKSPHLGDSNKFPLIQENTIELISTNKSLTCH